MPSASRAASPPDIIGRDLLIAEIWLILEERSLILSAERRFGKTYVIQKMEAEPPPGVLAFYQDMSDIHTAAAFTEKVCAKAKERLKWPQKITRQAADAFSRLKGGKANVKIPLSGPHILEASIDLPTLAAFPWQVKLTAAITELVNGQPGRVVFFWDEVPWMIGHIKESEGAETALELLELLRVLRQDPNLKSKLRMVYTGSIGFHHVLAEALAAPLVNDMKPSIFVLPLGGDYAQELAMRRLVYEKAKADDLVEIAHEIAAAVNGVPWYIKNLTQLLSAPGQCIRAGDADRFLAKMLKQSPEDWELPHYDTRIDSYYTSAQRPIARDLLDVLAVTEEIADFATLFNLLKAKRKIKDEEVVRHVLDLLRQDHYLWHNPYHFQLPLIRRFWRVRRGL